MSFWNKVFAFMGTKWFALLWVVILGIAIPFTYHNAKVVWLGKAALQGAGMGLTLWGLIAVFACNVLGLLFAFWKFMSLLSAKKPDAGPQKEW